MQGGFLKERFTNRSVGRREKLYNPEEWPMDRDHDAGWDYLWTILLAFGTVVAFVVVGMMAWIIGII